MSRVVLVAASSISASVGALIGFNCESWKRRFNLFSQTENESRRARSDTQTQSGDLCPLPLPIVSAASSPNLPVPYQSGVPQGKSNRTPEIMQHGFPGFDNIRSYGNYVLSYDRRHRTANWVFEHLTREQVKKVEGISRSDSKFLPDSSIHPYFRSTNDDYHKSGYDRGHLAAAGNHRCSQQAMDETFYLSNISPQVGKGFNRDAWNLLESFVRRLTKEFNNVYVCTGPLYLPSHEPNGKLYVKYEVIGKNHVAVPTHFFKVVVMEKGGQFELMSFVMPNQALGEKVDLRNYLVPVESIERAAGLLFFEKIPQNAYKKINGR